MTYHPADVLIATLHHAFRKGEDFRHDNSEWAEFFYSQRDKLPELTRIFELIQGDFGIRSNPRGEYASPLEQAYLNLKACGIITGIGLTERHQPTASLEKSYKKFAGKRVAPIEPVLIEIGLEFRKRFRIN